MLMCCLGLQPETIRMDGVNNLLVKKQVKNIPYVRFSPHMASYGSLRP
jgi:hypothetical protein